MPGSTLIPSARYVDAHAAIEWICRVLGFSKHAIYEGEDGSVHHAELVREGGMLMLSSAGRGSEFDRFLTTPAETGGRETISLTLIAADTEALYARAQAAGADIVQPLSDPPYGGKAFACRDPEGHIWWVGSYDPWAEHSASASTTKPLDL